MTERRDPLLVSLDRRLREIEAAQEALREERGRIVAARKALRGDRPSRRSVKQHDSARIAGPAAIAKVHQALARAGRTTQAEITRATGLNSGTVTHSLRALAAETPPRAAVTGKRFNSSNEWAVLGEGHTAAELQEVG